MHIHIRHLFIFPIVLFSLQIAKAQEINNLAFPEGTILDTTGEFGHIEKAGHGRTRMILLADVGFGWEIYKDFMDSNKDRYTMYAVTLPGSDGTPPLPMPAKDSSYGCRTGLAILQKALLALIEREKMDKPVLAGNLLIASWLALNTALQYPDKISKVIIFGAMPYATWPSPKDPSGKTPVSLPERSSNVDYYMAPRIFKTMARETWLKNLFQPYQYVNDTAMASKLYETSARTPIATMARYLCEFYTTDISGTFADIKVPVLVLIPGYCDEYFSKHLHSTDKMYFWDEWGYAATISNFRIEKVPDARLFVWVDQLHLVSRRIRDFLKS